MSKKLTKAICLTDGEEYDPTPQPMIIDANGKVVEWWPVPHLHMTSVQINKEAE